MNLFSKIFTREAAAALAAVTLAFAPVFASAHEVDADAKGGAMINLPGLSAKGVVINADGNVLVGGATVTNVSGGNITARSVLGGITLPWTIHTSSTTKTGGVDAVADIKSGDAISFAGVVDSTSSIFTVMAKAIRDWSADVVAKLTIHGTVTSVDSAHNSFVVQTPEKGTFTVTTNSSTTLKKAANSLSLSQIVVGDNVTVSGTTTSASALTASKVQVTERNNVFVKDSKDFWNHFAAGLFTHLKIGHQNKDDQNDD